MGKWASPICAYTYRTFGKLKKKLDRGHTIKHAIWGNSFVKRVLVNT